MPRGRAAAAPRFRSPEFLDYQQQSQVFDEIIGGDFEDALLTTREGTLQFASGVVTANTFQFLGVPAQLGRGIVPADGEPGAPRVFVMSHKMWLAHYAMDPGVVGRTFVLNGIPTTCVGVMPQRFQKQAADLWRPNEARPRESRNGPALFRLPGQVKTRNDIGESHGRDGCRRTTDRQVVSGQLPGTASPCTSSAGWTASSAGSGERSTRCLRQSASCC